MMGRHYLRRSRVYSPLRAIALVMVAVVTTMLTPGCKPSMQDEYQRYNILPQSIWRDHEELFFSFMLHDDHAPLRLHGVLRLSAECPYALLPIGVVYEDEHGNYSTEEVHVSLLPDRGRNVGFNLRTVTFALQHVIPATTSGLYTVSMRHLLTDSIAVDVIEVGIKASPILDSERSPIE